MGGIGNGRRMDHRFHSPHDGKRVARLGEVGLDVRGLPGKGPLEDAAREVRARDLVTGADERGGGGRPHLPPGARDQDAHQISGAVIPIPAHSSWAGP